MSTTKPKSTRKTIQGILMRIEVGGLPQDGLITLRACRRDTQYFHGWATETNTDTAPTCQVGMLAHLCHDTEDLFVHDPRVGFALDFVPQPLALSLQSLQRMILAVRPVQGALDLIREREGYPATFGHRVWQFLRAMHCQTLLIERYPWQDEDALKTEDPYIVLKGADTIISNVNALVSDWHKRRNTAYWKKTNQAPSTVGA